MSKVIGMVAVAGCLVVWSAQGQTTQGADAGLYVSPAYSGDSGGPYVSPAYNGSGAGEPARGTGPGSLLGSGGRGPRGYRDYGAGPSGAYSTPAFSGPVLGILVSPPPARPEKQQSKPGISGSSSSAPAARPDGKADPPGESSPAATNRVDSATAPSAESTNAPAGQGDQTLSEREPPRVAQTFLSAVSQAFQPARVTNAPGGTDQSERWPTGMSANQQTGMSALRA